MDKKSQNNNFLQSQEWRKFQEGVGRKTYSITGDCLSASIVKHRLPLVGSYFYIPRGPVIETRDKRQETRELREIIELAKKESAGWIRIDLANEEVLENIKNSTNYKIQKAPHDMQPKEIFVVDISKPEEELLAQMSQKTRYNIKLAEKRGVKIAISDKGQATSEKYTKEFLRLVKATAKRKGISFHAENYYRKMFETIPENMLKLYIAEYENRIIAANLVVFYGDTATYLHGATDDEYRNVMAPHLLQWQAILDAKKAGCIAYDFGGVKTVNSKNSWEGITKFKLGFSPSTKAIEFSGSYDIIINKNGYLVYRLLQKIKSLI